MITFPCLDSRVIAESCLKKHGRVDVWLYNEVMVTGKFRYLSLGIFFPSESDAHGLVVYCTNADDFFVTLRHKNNDPKPAAH